MERGRIENRGDQVDTRESRNNEEVPGHCREDQVERHALLPKDMEERRREADREQSGLEYGAGDVRCVAEHSPFRHVTGGDEHRSQRPESIDGPPEVKADVLRNRDVDAVEKDE